MDPLDINLMIMSLSDDKEIQDQALTSFQNLATLDPARAQQLQGRMEFRQKTMQALKGGITRPEDDAARRQANNDNLNTSRDAQQSGDAPVISGVPDGLDSFMSGVSDYISNNVAQTLSTLDDQLFNPIQQAGSAIAAAPTYLDQLAQDVLDPEAALRNSQAQAIQAQEQAALAEQSELLGTVDQFPTVDGQSTVGIQDQAAQVSSVLNYLQSGQVPAQDQALLAARQAAEIDFQKASNARNGLLMDSQRQQGANIAQQEQNRRLFENLSLQRTPQVPSANLNAAAAFAQQGAIGAAPANVTQNLALTQALAPQIQVPSLKTAANTNVSQRNRAADIDQRAQANIQRQQIKALELAMKSFQTQIARPILQTSR